MLVLISPAKTLDFDSKLPELNPTHPRFQAESTQIIKKLRSLSGKQLSKLMDLSKELTLLNQSRYQQWEPSFDSDDSRPAVFAFTGEVYRGMQPQEWSNEHLNFAQESLRILSGLHGVLRPLDKIRPYRLEMGTKLPIQRSKNLYQYWQDKLTHVLNEDLKQTSSNYVINLASQEYAKAIKLDKINAPVITPVFKEMQGDQLKVVMMYAKHARGEMASYIIKNGITNPEDLKGFKSYSYMPSLSTSNEWVFVR